MKKLLVIVSVLFLVLLGITSCKYSTGADLLRKNVVYFRDNPDNPYCNRSCEFIAFDTSGNAYIGSMIVSSTQGDIKISKESTLCYSYVERYDLIYFNARYCEVKEGYIVMYIRDETYLYFASKVKVIFE